MNESLTAYHARKQAWVWCDHEQRWHLHGLADGHHSAHCACPESPYRETGYVLQIAGPLTPAVLASHTERMACPGCQETDQCSCTEKLCLEGLSCGNPCAQHADPECGSCWRTHGGPGYGACRVHGILPVHAHVYSNRCVADYIAPAGSDYQPPCQLAIGVLSYWPKPDQTGGLHLHCPACAAEHAVEPVIMRMEVDAIARTAGVGWQGTREPARPEPLCRECRDLLTPSWLARFEAQTRKLEVVA